MDLALYPGELLVKQGGANLQRGAEAVGGKLFLTDRRLVFRSHGMNIQNAGVDIPLTDVTGLAKAWTKMFGAIPLVPNSIVMHTAAGIDFSFVVMGGRGTWISAIEACLPTASA